MTKFQNTIPCCRDLPGDLFDRLYDAAVINIQKGLTESDMRRIHSDCMIQDLHLHADCALKTAAIMATINQMGKDI